jgi:hypothetical protein
MRGLECRGNLHQDGNGLFGSELFPFLDQPLEVATLDIFHRNELDALGLAEIENADGRCGA